MSGWLAHADFAPPMRDREMPIKEKEGKADRKVEKKRDGFYMPRHQIAAGGLIRLFHGAIYDSLGH
jgi:hypothetical protein